MFELKVRKIGKSLGVVLPMEALSRLQVREGDRLLLIEGPGGSCQVARCDSLLGEKMKKAEDIIREYRHTIKDLAK